MAVFEFVSQKSWRVKAGRESEYFQAMGGVENTPRYATAQTVLARFEPHPSLRQPEISRSRISTPVRRNALSHQHRLHHQLPYISGIARYESCHPDCQPFSENERKKIPTVLTPCSSARWLSHGRASEVFQQASGPACHRRQHSFSLCASSLLVCNASQLFLQPPATLSRYNSFRPQSAPAFATFTTDKTRQPTSWRT